MAKRKRPLTDKQRSQLRVFASELDESEHYYCGDLTSYKAMREGVGNVVAGLIDELYNGSRTSVDLNIQVVKMTDKQVANLPEL